MKSLRHLLIVAYMLGMMHEFTPHEHHGEARETAELVSEDHAAECETLLRHLLEALGALEHPSTGAEFHFYAPDEAGANKAAEVVFSPAVLPQAVEIVKPTSASLDVTVPVHPPPDKTYRACPPPGRGSPLA
ncbi:MAG: hypothetical protein EBT52_04325 [Flavobacteriia bacterium]|nr:hypothetical protein [Flavobacteriia bacterium]